MVDETLVFRKLAEIEEYLDQIREYRGISIEAYANDWKTQRIVERTLQIMIETCLDIASHIIADHRFRVADSFADMFKVLHEKNIIDDTLYSSLEKMAHFRNYIMHHYDRIDPSVVVIILRQHVEDISKFKAAVIDFTKAQRGRQQ